MAAVAFLFPLWLAGINHVTTTRRFVGKTAGNLK